MYDSAMAYTHETSNVESVDCIVPYVVNVCVCVHVRSRVFCSVALLTGQSYPSFILFHFFLVEINKTDNLRGIVVVQIIIDMNGFFIFENLFR